MRIRMTIVMENSKPLEDKKKTEDVARALWELVFNSFRQEDESVTIESIEAEG